MCVFSYLSVYCMHEGVWEIPKKVLGPVEMKLQAVGSQHIGTGQGLWSLR